MLSEQIEISSINTIYKYNQGMLVQLYMEKLQLYFGSMRKICHNKKYLQYLLPQRVIYLAILKQKCIKYQNGIISKQSLVNQLKLLENNILKSQEIQLNQILNFQKIIPQKLLTNFIQVNTISQNQDIYLCQAIKASCNKRQNKGFFTSIFNLKKPEQYTNDDYKKIIYHFGQSFAFLDYDAHNNYPQNFSYDQNTSYILKFKNEYYLLYQKGKSFSKIKSNVESKNQNLDSYYFNQLEKSQNKKQQHQVKIIKKQVMTPGDIQKIFLKQKADQYQLNVKEPINSQINKQKSVIQKVSNLFPANVQCHFCSNKFTEFQCLKWNYQNYCQGCLISPHVNTSHIPKNLIQKYFKERNLEVKIYRINCPQCQGESLLKNYKPTNKPTSYTCQLCLKKICMKHLSMINNCFCQCTICKTPTININEMKINLCQSCNYRLCLNCGQNSNKMCKCICSLCLNYNKPDHQCEKRCHTCLNKHIQLRTCKCTQPICYGCYYFFLQKNFKDGFCRNAQLI